jgi:hypothetical protein
MGIIAVLQTGALYFEYSVEKLAIRRISRSSLY